MTQITLKVDATVIELLARMRISELSDIESRYSADMVKAGELPPEHAEELACEAGNEFYRAVNNAIHELQADKGYECLPSYS